MNLWQQSELPPADVDAYLICPRGGNTGDALIADGSERFLIDHGIRVWRSDGSMEQASLAGDFRYIAAALSRFRGMLFFSGGGNIGIYPDNGLLRETILAHSGPRHRFLVFSQSALQPEKPLADPRVTVWCRDRVSAVLLTQAGTRVELVPDMALYLDDVIPKYRGGKGTFFIRRTAGGDTESIDHQIRPSCPAEDLTLRHPLEHVIDTLKSYDTVIADRLHGGLIALMMRKKTVLLPVGYHKNRAFYETWLHSNPGVAFVDRQPDLRPKMLALHTPNDDLKALFCGHAEPALDRFLMGH